MVFGVGGNTHTHIHIQKKNNINIGSDAHKSFNKFSVDIFV